MNQDTESIGSSKNSLAAGGGGGGHEEPATASNRGQFLILMLKGQLYLNLIVGLVGQIWQLVLQWYFHENSEECD